MDYSPDDEQAQRDASPAMPQGLSPAEMRDYEITGGSEVEPQRKQTYWEGYKKRVREHFCASIKQEAPSLILGLSMLVSMPLFYTVRNLFGWW